MDPKPTPFLYELAGCVNGSQASVRLEGSIARDEVRFEITETSPEKPLLWDAQVLALAAIDPVVMLALDPEAIQRSEAPEIFRVESGLCGEGMKAVGRFVLSGCWSAEDSGVVVRAQIVEGWLNFEPLERVARIEEAMPMGVLCPEDGGCVATRAWAVGTSRGNQYFGTSVLLWSPGEGYRCTVNWTQSLRWSAECPTGQPAQRSPRAYRVSVTGVVRT